MLYEELGRYGFIPITVALDRSADDARPYIERAAPTHPSLIDSEHRVYDEGRRTQVDMRFAKVLRFGRTRADIGVDLWNVFNTNYATGYQTTFTTTADSIWGRPNAIYPPRFVRLNFTINY